jgi:hypothetical protein
MPIQYPASAPYQSAMDIGNKHADANQRQTHNALVNDSIAMKNEQNQQGVSRDNQTRLANVFVEVGTRGPEYLDKNPESWPIFRQDVIAAIQSSGGDISKIPDENARGIELLEGFSALKRAGETFLSQGGPGYQDIAPGEEVPTHQRAPSGQINSVGGMGNNGNARVEYMDYLTESLSPEDELAARRIQAGLDPRAGISADERIANDPDLTDSVAESQSEIRSRTKFAEMSASSRAQTIDKSYSTMLGVEKNIRNLDKALSAIDAGATTGVIESKYFPSFREATIKLEQIQKELGLDVIGSVTFGALSKGELDLALETALPVGLKPPELRKFLEEKKAAQNKLLTYYQEQIDFLDQDGTIAGFLRSRKRNIASQVDVAPPEDASADFDAEWAAAASGSKVQAPDGTWRQKP